MVFKFDKSKLEEKAGKLAQKSGDMMESGKIKLNIGNMEKEINALKNELGNTRYNAYKAGQNAEADMMEICKKIDEKYAAIDAANKQIEELKNK